MRELGHRPAQRLVKRNLLGRVGKMVVAADHVRDFHQRVVHHHYVVVNRNAARPQDDGIAHCFVGEFDHAAHDVVKTNGMLGYGKPDCRGLTTGATAFGLRRIEPAAFSRIHRRAVLRHRSIAIALQLLLRAKAQVGFALFHQALGMLAVDRETVALAIGRVRAADVGTFIPIDAEPFQIFQQLVFVARFTALKVSILDAQNHGAAGLTGEKPVIKCGAGVAHMQLSSGGRSEPYTYLGIFAHSLMLARAAGVGHPV